MLPINPKNNEKEKPNTLDNFECFVLPTFLFLSDSLKSRISGQSIRSPNWGLINMSAAQHSLSSYDDVHSPLPASAAITAPTACWAGDRTQPVRRPDRKHESLLLEVLFAPWCSTDICKFTCDVKSVPLWTTHAHLAARIPGIFKK